MNCCQIHRQKLQSYIKLQNLQLNIILRKCCHRHIFENFALKCIARTCIPTSCDHKRNHFLDVTMFSMHVRFVNGLLEGPFMKCSSRQISHLEYTLCFYSYRLCLSVSCLCVFILSVSTVPSRVLNL